MSVLKAEVPPELNKGRVIPTTGSNKFEITGMTYEEGKKRVVMENSVWKDVETISLP